MQELSRDYGAPLPSRGQERWWPVYGVQGHVPSIIVILSDQWWGQWFHFTGRESFPCEMHPGCHLCKDRDPNRWCGYVAALCGTNAVECVFGLTANAGRLLKPTLDKRGSLRGLEVMMQRRKPKEGKKPKINDPVQAVIKREYPTLGLRADFPVLPSLHRLWGIQSVRRGEPRVVPFTAPAVVASPGFDYGALPEVNNLPF